MMCMNREALDEKLLMLLRARALVQPRNVGVALRLGANIGFDQYPPLGFSKA